MADYSAMIRRAFEMGSVQDAAALFETCVLNAYPSFHFRKLELIRFLGNGEYMEGRSMNHVFEVKKASIKEHAVWEVSCHRVTMGRTPDKTAFLDYLTLDFLDYGE